MHTHTHKKTKPRQNLKNCRTHAGCEQDASEDFCPCGAALQTQLQEERVAAVFLSVYRPDLKTKKEMKKKREPNH